MTELLDAFKKFVFDAESGQQFSKWAHDNPGEVQRWNGFRDAVIAGEKPLTPVMKTPHGWELVDAGNIYLSAAAVQRNAGNIILSLNNDDG